jgi:hypothetical protein
MSSDDAPREDEESRAERVRGAMSELREYSQGNLDTDRSDVHPVAGLVDDDVVRSYMVFCAEQYDPEPRMPASYWGSQHAQRLLRQHGTEAAQTALSSGDLSRAEYLTGWQDYDADVSGLKAAQQLEDWLLFSERVKVCYLAGHMGEGKTDFAHLMVEVVRHRSQRHHDLDAADVRTNIPSSELPSITDYDRFREWVEDGSVDSNRWFIFDEASSQLTGYSHDRAEVEQLVSSLVKRARKSGCNFILIGHTGMDLHADLRRLADYVEKPSLKSARFYSSVKRGDGVGHLFDLGGLPETSLQYDTADEAPWDWGSALDDDDDDEVPDEVARDWRKQRIAALWHLTDVEQSTLSAAFDVSERTVRRYLKEVDESEVLADEAAVE